MPRPATRDVLGLFWQHTTRVQRLLGSGAHGNSYASETEEVGLVEDSNRLVLNAAGEQAISSATVFYPAAIAEIPLGSQITLEAPFLTHPRQVIAVSVHNAGILPTPDYVEIALQ